MCWQGQKLMGRGRGPGGTARRQRREEGGGATFKEGCSNLSQQYFLIRIASQRMRSTVLGEHAIHPHKPPDKSPSYQVKQELSSTYLGKKHQPPPHSGPTHPGHESGDGGQKIIPGYNFDSLFRKKSHIRLARKRNKEELQKRNINPKVEPAEKQAKNIQKGHWTPEENKFYHWFLQLHNKHFVYKYLRRTDKIFKSMANFIQTREAEQCRSHHQKMEKKYHSFYQILIQLRMDFYAGLSTDPLRSELEDQGYKLKEGTLITEHELKHGDSGLKLPKCSDNEEDSLRNQLQDSGLESGEQSNILAQNYENGLAIRNIPY